MASPFPPNISIATVFRALYPEFTLITVGSTYIVYPPAGTGPLLYIADSLGAIARQIAEVDNLDVELADLIEDDNGEDLPRRK